MPKAYSQDLRNRVIDAVEKGGMSCRAAARRYEISESVAIKWLERFQRVGSREPVGHGGHRRSVLAPHRDFLDAARAEKPDGTLQDLCATICAHAHEHGCDTDWLYLCDGNVNNCLDLFVSQPECHTAYLKDTACQADYSNPCDFEGMAAACLATFCSMRHICSLPDPKCP